MAKLSDFSNSKTARLVAKILMILAAAFLSTLVFGLLIPFTLIAFNILPNIGLAGLVYLFSGGVFGFLFGSISASVSLFRSEKIISRYYAIMMISLAIIGLLYLISYISFPEAYSHI